jgi:CelD/BcsL family acetyltransferase involved in cellulose biosynthesis
VSIDMMALSAATHACSVDISRGSSADTLLQDPKFQQAWSRLAAACRWGTVWQSWDYTEAWLSTYRETYEALLVLQRDAADQLIGLLPLAIQRNTGEIVHIGAGQAEYQVWLAHEANGNSFAEQAMNALARDFPRQRLRLKYLPPGAPVGWCSAKGQWSSRAILREQKRPLMVLGPTSHIEKSLQKKSNKSRIQRLQKIAPLHIAQLNTRAELESVLDTIAEYCDLRQGAINSSLPFREDPRKREFWLRLMEKPGLVHASTLMLGNSIIAAHIGPLDRGTVVLGIIAHSPFLAEHSPGKLLMLLLARELGRQGFREFDLTPGGAYKDRFADHVDHAYCLEIYFSGPAYARAVVQSDLHTALVKVLGNRRPAFVKGARHIANSGAWASLAQVARTTWQRLLAHSRYHFYNISTEKARNIAVVPIFNVDSVADLLLYNPSRKADPSKKQFFLNALQRLEAGARVFTFTEGGVLLHCAWLGDAKSSVGIASVDRTALQENTCVLWNSYTHPTASARSLQKYSVAQRLQDAAVLPGTQAILVRIDADDLEAKHFIEEAGLITSGIAVRETRPRLRSRSSTFLKEAHSSCCDEPEHHLVLRSEYLGFERVGRHSGDGRDSGPEGIFLQG